jgi:hypothetical protein
LRVAPQNALFAADFHESDMVKMKHIALAWIAPALGLLSCAAPKATVVDQPKSKSEPAVVAPAVPDPGSLAPPDRGIRLPDMLALPGDAEFRATTPTPPKKGAEAGAVIARPPTDPPSRPQPKDAQPKDAEKE